MLRPLCIVDDIQKQHRDRIQAVLSEQAKTLTNSVSVMLKIWKAVSDAHNQIEDPGELPRLVNFIHKSYAKTQFVATTDAGIALVLTTTLGQHQNHLVALVESTAAALANIKAKVGLELLGNDSFREPTMATLDRLITKLMRDVFDFGFCCSALIPASDAVAAAASPMRRHSIAATRVVAAAAFGRITPAMTGTPGRMYCMCPGTAELEIKVAGDGCKHPGESFVACAKHRWDPDNCRFFLWTTLMVCLLTSLHARYRYRY